MTNFQKFILKSQNKFKDLYDYSITNYSTILIKLQLRCTKHDLIFSVFPIVHLESVSGGCPECIKEHKLKIGESYKSNLNEFIEKANKIHDFKYDYSKFEYTLARTKSTIICPTHGEFEMNPNNHLMGKNCKKCSLIIAGNKKTKKASMDFIAEANIKHNNTYTYNNFNYIKAKTRSYITCSIHR